MEDVNDLVKPDRVDRPIGVATMILDDLEGASTLALPGFRLRMLAAELRQPESMAHLVLHRRGKAQEVPLRRADPVERLLSGCQLPNHTIISQI